MRKDESKPAWLMDLCKNKSPGIILIDGDGEKVPCLDFAYEIGAMMVENGLAPRLCVWSWQAFLWLHGRYLMGDSSTDVHCWTITKNVGIMPPTLQPLASTLIEDDMNIEKRRDLSRLIHAPESAHGKLCVGDVDLTIADFRNKLSLPDMERINGAAKRAGKTIIVVSRLTDAQGKPYETASYGELAMRISVEQGIDLAECAESLISVRESGNGYRCRPLKIWNDDRLGDESAVMLDAKGHFKVIS
jgi:hypothetical protein